MARNDKRSKLYTTKLKIKILKIAQPMTLSYIFSKNYLFDPNPTVISKLYLPLLIIFGLLIVLATIIYLQKSEVKKIVGRFIVPFLSTGVLGLAYLFARYESLIYLSSRFFLFLIVVLFVVWDIVLLVKTVRFVPQHLNSKKVEDRYKKYLPKSKKKLIINGRGN